MRRIFRPFVLRGEQVCKSGLPPNALTFVARPNVAFLKTLIAPFERPKNYAHITRTTDSSKKLQQAPFPQYHGSADYLLNPFYFNP